MIFSPVPKIFLFPAVMLLTVATALGIPARPGLIPVPQPDGSVIDVRLFGDENFNYMTDASGEWLLTHDEEGRIVPMLDREGMPMRTDSLSLETMRRKAPGMARLPKYDDEGRSLSTTLGKGYRTLVVLLEFSDAGFTVSDPQLYYTRMLNEHGFADNGSRGCAAQYFEDCSRGRYSPVFDVARVVKLPNTAASYSGRNGASAMRTAAVYALKKIAPEINFARYDTDDDGTVDNVHFIFAGYAASDTGLDRPWSGCSTLGTSALYFNGKKIDAVSYSAELIGPAVASPKIAGIGPVCHEFAHALGLPNLTPVTYGDSTPNISPGDFSVMDTGCYNGNGTCPPLMSTYERWVLHWDNLEEITEPCSLSLRPLTDEGAEGYRFTVASNGAEYRNEFYLAEVRAKSGWDAFIPDEGILFWHITYSEIYWLNNAVNNYGVSRVTTIPLQPDNTVMAWPGSFDYAWVCPGYHSQFTPSCSNIIKWQPYITDIRYDRETRTGSLDFNLFFDRPGDIVTVHEPKADGKSAFLLSWDKLDGDDVQYAVTVSVFEKNGKISYLHNLNKYITDTNSMRVSDITADEETTTWEVSVVPVRGLPSEAGGESFTFTPAELEGWVNVRPVSDDLLRDIYATPGEIHAPEGARIYTLQGIPCPSRNLPPAIYIVTCGSASRLVQVP